MAAYFTRSSWRRNAAVSQAIEKQGPEISETAIPTGKISMKVTGSRTSGFAYRCRNSPIVAATASPQAAPGEICRRLAGLATSASMSGPSRNISRNIWQDR
ncbi:MAG: hypothetical protein WD793_11925 [Steroidobacteraceae bacterium]